jgi:hypothetical protein
MYILNSLIIIIIIINNIKRLHQFRKKLNFKIKYILPSSTHFDNSSFKMNNEKKFFTVQ